MRFKFFFLIIIVFSAKYSFSQGSLQFNRVLNISHTVCGGFNAQCQIPGGYTDTVPAGKAWKIEFATGDGNYQVRPGISVNGVSLQVWNSQNLYKWDSGPIWLGGGSLLGSYAINNNSNNSHTDQLTIFLSILEFNIVP